MRGKRKTELLYVENSKGIYIVILMSLICQTTLEFLVLEVPVPM